MLSESVLGRGKVSDLVIDVCMLIIVESSVWNLHDLEKSESKYQFYCSETYSSNFLHL